MTWMKHTVQNEQANLGRNPLAVSGIARPTKTHMRRGIHRIIGSVSAHVRHSVSSAAAARRTEQQAHRIRSVHGANIIAPEHHDPLAARLSRAFLTPFTLILLALAAISLYTNVYLAAPGDEDPSTAIIIGVMVLISGGISFWQDTRGAAAADALKGLVSITCRCVREDTGAAEIPLADVVPGDLIELAAGDIIPADLRIVTAKDLFLTQAALTGESDPVEKTPAAIAEPAGRALVIDDCTNFAFAGTTVQSGSGTGVVVTTGARTYLGGIASALDSRPTTTSFDAGVASVSRVLVGFMLVMCPIVFVLCGLTKGDWLDALLFSISVAVGITPQMLPVIVTTCLARGAEAMRAKDVVVKEISSIQNLGAMDVLCCDKTGTLTRDKIVLERHLDVLGAPSDRVLRHAYLNSLFQTGLRNLMDEAIIERAEALAAGGRSMDARAGRTSPGTPGQAGAGASPAAPRRTSPEADAIAAAREQWRLVDEIPFDFDRRRMSVVVVDGTGKRQLITKGAVEEMLDVCSEVEVDADVLPLTPEQAERILDRVRGLNERGMRVVGVAQRNDVPARDLTAEDERDMTLIGYLAFLDPPKSSAKAAVDELSGLGVTVKVLTGDNAAVAATVCEQVGINARNMLTGAEIDMLSDEELAERAEHTGLFAKLSPLQKARIVNVLRERLRHLRGHRRRRRQGERRHHLAQEGPHRARPWHRRWAPHVRQHHQVHQDHRELELRQRPLRAGGGRVPAVFAHERAAAAPARHGVHGELRRAALGSRRRVVPGAPAHLGRARHRELHARTRPREFDLRHPDLRGDVLGRVPARGGRALGRPHRPRPTRAVRPRVPDRLVRRVHVDPDPRDPPAAHRAAAVCAEQARRLAHPPHYAGRGPRHGNALRPGRELGTRPDSATGRVLWRTRDDDGGVPTAHEHRQGPIRPRARRVAVDGISYGSAPERRVPQGC